MREIEIKESLQPAAQDQDQNQDKKVPKLRGHQVLQLAIDHRITLLKKEEIPQSPPNMMMIID